MWTTTGYWTSCQWRQLGSTDRKIRTSGQSNLTKGRIAAAHGRSPCLISWRSVKAFPIYRNFFWFWTWRPSAVLNFKKFAILKAVWMKRINMRNHAKFRGNWSKRYRDIAIRLPRYRDFPASEMVAVHHLGFLKVRIFETQSCSECHFAFSCHISWISVKPLSRYGDFLTFCFKMATVRHLGFVVCVFGQPSDST